MTNTEILRNSHTLFDKIGRIMIENNRVMRVIKDSEYAKHYTELIKSDGIKELFFHGLIKTWIPDELNQEDKSLIIEHKKIDFILHPCEYTDDMFWQTTNMFINLCQQLYKKGFIIKDAHPWNVTFDNYRPVFFDFCSIIKQNHITQSWLNEFIKYFGIPIALASKSISKPLSIEYRREHLNGFGIKLLNHKFLQRTFFRSLIKCGRYKSNPEVFFSKISEWLQKNKPASAKKLTWANYDQSHKHSFKKPTTLKQKFVYESLITSEPETVLDLAANKGYYAGMAASLGAKVLAFDYEEHCVNLCHRLAQEENLKITPAFMNFNLPTPGHGIGMIGKNAFERFKSDVVLALGLIHHICLAQGIPVQIFCNICRSYASHGVIIEYVDPSDKHVQQWQKTIPEDYSIQNIQYYLKEEFPHLKKSEPILTEGVNRTFLYFYK